MRRYLIQIIELFEYFNKQWNIGNKQGIKNIYETYSSFQEAILVKLQESLDKNFKQIIKTEIEDDF